MCMSLWMQLAKHVAVVTTELVAFGLCDSIHIRQAIELTKSLLSVKRTCIHLSFCARTCTHNTNGSQVPTLWVLYSQRSVFFKKISNINNDQSRHSCRLRFFDVNRNAV